MHWQVSDVGQQTAHLTVCGRRNCNVKPLLHSKPCEQLEHEGILACRHFLLINILETTGKLLFFMAFRSSPNKLWITLLKTLRDDPQTLEK
jgi:hypothetical protein